MATTRVRNLRSIRYQLNRSIHKLEARIAKYRARIAAIEVELAEASVPLGLPRVRGRSQYFRRGELRKSCIEALAEAGCPMHMRDIVRAVMLAKQLDTDNPALAEAVVRPLQSALRAAHAEGRVRKVGGNQSRFLRWELIPIAAPPDAA